MYPIDFHSICFTYYGSQWGNQLSSYSLSLSLAVKHEFSVNKHGG